MGEAFESLSVTRYFLLVYSVSPLQLHECFRSFMVAVWPLGTSMHVFYRRFVTLYESTSYHYPEEHNNNF